MFAHPSAIIIKELKSQLITQQLFFALFWAKHILLMLMSADMYKAI